MGKTTLAVEIITKYILKHVRRCFAVCPTFADQPSLLPLRQVPHAFTNQTVFLIPSDEVFEHIYRILVKRPAPTLLFVDDAAAESATNKGNKGAFSRLCLAAPHLHLYIVGCFQRLTSASPAYRDNTEGLISFVPSKMQDVETIIQEFNPSPAHPQSKLIVKEALTQAWDCARFAFIWREAFTGKIYYYAGFISRVKFHLKKEQNTTTQHSSSDDDDERRNGIKEVCEGSSGHYDKRTISQRVDSIQRESNSSTPSMQHSEYEAAPR